MLSYGLPGKIDAWQPLDRIFRRLLKSLSKTGQQNGWRTTIFTSGCGQITKCLLPKKEGPSYLTGWEMLTKRLQDSKYDYSPCQSFKRAGCLILPMDSPTTRLNQMVFPTMMLPLHFLHLNFMPLPLNQFQTTTRKLKTILYK